jgi:transposase
VHVQKGTIMNSVLGIDVAKATVDVVLLLEEQASIHGQFDNNPTGFKQLKRWLDKRGVQTLHACLEATGNFSDALATYLHEAGYTVSVVNPARISAYAKSQLRRNKTDKLDAALIAQFCRTQTPPAWSPPDPAWKELQGLVRHLQDLESTRQSAKNRLSASPSSPAVVDQLKAQIAFLTQQMLDTKRLIADHLDQHPDLRQQRDLLTSIPGIGDLTAGKLLAELRSIAAFDNPAQLVAFAGLNPRHHVSGSSIRGKTVISKQGRPSIRAALYMPAVVAKKHNPILSIFAARLAQRGLAGTQIIVAVMRKLLHLAFGILKSGQPFDPLFLLKAAP